MSDGRVIIDDSAPPIHRVKYVGVPSNEEWHSQFDIYTKWAREGSRYAVVIDAREVGLIPPSYRRAVASWIDRDRQHLKANCAGGALVFSNALQRGLWTAVVWLTPTPIPVKIFADPESGLAWLKSLLNSP